MAKATKRFVCSSCGATSTKWLGRCSTCQNFATIEEVPASSSAAGSRPSAVSTQPPRPARSVAEVDHSQPLERIKTGIGEFDRVIGGGFVSGQVTLMSGEPGAGKSTLLLAVADAVAGLTGKLALYISGEESVEQLAVRARRIGTDERRVLLADDSDLGVVLGHIEAHAQEISLIIVDSIQTIASKEVEGRAGGVTQVMESAQVLTRVAKSLGVPMVIVGQVTKDSNVAGPRALEHIVDTTLSLEGDKGTSLRMLRAVKNRFGPTEVAAFEQTDAGIAEVVDPSGHFVDIRDEAVAGTCVTVTIDGQRPLITEIQALVSATNSPNPRRSVSGLDSSRAAMLIATSERWSALKFFDKDVYLATVGGIRLSDPSTDLAVCLAAISARREEQMPTNLAVFGEVTLTGSIRPVPMLAERVREATRLGYTRILVPRGSAEKIASIATRSSLQVAEVSSLGDAIAAIETVRLKA